MAPSHMKIYCMILRNAVYIMEYGNTLVKENKATRTLFCEVRVPGVYFRRRRDTKLLLSSATYLSVPYPHSPLIACSLVGFVWLVFGGPLKRKNCFLWWKRSSLVKEQIASGLMTCSLRVEWTKLKRSKRRERTWKDKNETGTVIQLLCTQRD